MLERKYRKNAHVLGLEMWRCPEAGRTFRARIEETEALRCGRGRERGQRIRIRWRSCCRQGRTRFDLRDTRTKTLHVGGGLSTA